MSNNVSFEKGSKAKEKRCRLACRVHVSNKLMFNWSKYELYIHYLNTAGYKYVINNTMRTVRIYWCLLPLESTVQTTFTSQNGRFWSDVRCLLCTGFTLLTCNFYFLVFKNFTHIPSWHTKDRIACTTCFTLWKNFVIWVSAIYLTNTITIRLSIYTYIIIMEIQNLVPLSTREENTLPKQKQM